jgi:hypothetical protein
LNEGVSFGRIVMFMVAGTAQNCGAGVKIYGYVPGAADDITEGDQVPVSAGTLFEEAGKPGTAPL